MGIELKDDFTGKAVTQEAAASANVTVNIQVGPTGDGVSMNFGPFIFDREAQKDVRNVVRYQEIHKALTETLIVALGKAGADFEAKVAALKSP